MPKMEVFVSDSLVHQLQPGAEEWISPDIGWEYVSRHWYLSSCWCNVVV